MSYNLSKSKFAYPVNDSYRELPGQYNIPRWIQAFNDINTIIAHGTDDREAFKHVTESWSDSESYNFKNWIKFYQERNDVKYVEAQSSYYVNDEESYFLPYKNEQQETRKELDINDVVDSASIKQKEQQLKNHRKKIVSRLDSVEKLIRSEEGQLLTKNEFESLMESIYDLKKKINKIKAASLFEPIITKEANRLSRDGFKKSYALLIAIAAPETPPAGLATTPATNSNDAVAGPLIGALDPSGPKEDEDGIEGFIKNMNPSDDTFSDNDSEAIQPDDDGEIAITAQEIPKPPNGEQQLVKTNPEPIKNIAPLKKTTEPTTEVDAVSKSNSDDLIYSALKQITVQDVIKDLKELSYFHKVKEVPRKLALVDIKLNALGLVAFFPSLSEATNKALESNNYISSRIDEILNRLQGTVATNVIDVANPKEIDNPNAQAIKNNLQDLENKEHARKELRKNKENEDLDMSLQSKDNDVLEMPVAPAKEAPPVKPEIPQPPPAPQVPPKPAV